MRSRACIWSSVFCLVFMACGRVDEPSPVTEEDANVIGGETDTGDPGVVAVYAQQPGSDAGFLCTGSVIAPTVILTAAHCVSPSETGRGATFTVLTSANINRGGGQQLAVREVHANPLWSTRNLAGGHDQGIVILGEPTSLPVLPFNRQALAAQSVGKPLRIVGYGLNDGARQTGAGVKRQVLTKLQSIAAMLIGVGDSRHGTCNGDSGGPAFMKIDGVETIVGCHLVRQRGLQRRRLRRARRHRSGVHRHLSAPGVRARVRRTRVRQRRLRWLVRKLQRR